ncbi:MAG: response regulator [Sulfurospirillaceae bacterium]|nr:response regulator [Sulfurospirillaceae bacterium]
MKKFKLLIIDDLPENISLMTNILKDDYEIVVANSAHLGLELAKKDPKVDLILLDIIMPQIDGYEVCKILKSHVCTQDIPVIFLTILDETSDVEKGFLSGGVDYVTKPFEPSILKARVKTHCILASQKKELKRFNHSLEALVVERTKELEQANLQVERLARQAALGDVIAMIAHQWKQPMSVISMAVNYVLSDIELGQLNPEETQREMQNIIKQIDHMTSTIDNFRNFFKPNKEKQIVNVITQTAS